jgi:GR25 family glycosyltransferase involved in LPS biosynthesis
MQPIQVISLERSAKRRAEFIRRHPRLPFEFFAAIDGAALTPDAIAATGLFRPGLHYTAGAHGAALSHHALWTRAAAGHEPLTIAEDDAIFREDFAAAQAELRAGLLPGWDIVLWGWNFDSVLALRVLPGVPGVMAFDPSTVAKALAGFPFTTARPQAFRLDVAFGLPAYTISPNGAKKLLARCFPLADFTRTLPLAPQPVRNDGIDTAMTNLYPAADAYVCFPPLAMTPNDRAASTIQNGHYVSF